MSTEKLQAALRAQPPLPPVPPNGFVWQWYGDATFLKPRAWPCIVHKFMLANNATDRVHAFTFESPAPSWDGHGAWYGTPILSQLVVSSVMRVPFTRDNLQ